MGRDLDRDRLDLSPLDPAADRERWEGLVRELLLRATPELERRAAAAGALGLLARWAVPALPLAAALAGLALAGLFEAGRARATEPALAPVVAALDPPDPAYSWLAEARSPAASDLILAMQQGMP
jgi:hypothetical protein